MSIFSFKLFISICLSPNNSQIFLSFLTKLSHYLYKMLMTFHLFPLSSCL